MVLLNLFKLRLVNSMNYMLFTSCKKPYNIWSVKLMLEKQEKDILK